MKIKGTCAGCGREREAPPEVMAKNPKCMYCGGELRMSDEARAAVEEAATAAAEAGKRPAKTKANCPICGRALLVPPDAQARCTYCGCPFAPGAAGAPATAGPLGTTFHPEVTPELDAQRDKLLAKLRAAVSADGSTLTPLVDLGLRAISWRYAHGNIDQEELSRQVAAMGAAEALGAGELPVNVCPLIPPEAGELIAQSICGNYESAVENLAGGGAVLRVTTGSHQVNDDAAGNIAVGVAVGGLVGGVIGAAASESQGYVIRHYLRVDLHPCDQGATLEFSSEWAGGRPQQMNEIQKELRSAILAALPDHALRAVLLKAVFGDWLMPVTSLGLQPAQLAARLGALGPELEGLMELVER
jgi:hypothetical protein